MAKKAPNPIDKHVGSRVRMRRMMLSMSQEKLGDALGLTFQQVQKYEKGTNRIGASRLQAIANTLQVPVSFFFEGAPSEPKTARLTKPQSVQTDDDLLEMQQFVTNPLGLRFARTFFRIKSPQLRTALVEMAEGICAETDAMKMGAHIVKFSDAGKRKRAVG